MDRDSWQRKAIDVETDEDFSLNQSEKSHCRTDRPLWWW